MRMNRRWWVLSGIVLALVLGACSGPSRPAQTTATQPATVRAVLFWAETCPHCHEVIERVLPPLEERYGEQLEIKRLEVGDPQNYQIWAQAMEDYQVPPSQQGVPMLIIGDDVLVGTVEIAERLPGLIEQHLAAGGVDYPAIPNLLTPAEAAATPAATGGSQPIYVAYFYQPGCQECDRVRLALDYLKQRYPQLSVCAYDVREYATLCEWLGERAGVPIGKRLTAPAIFVGNEALVGDDLDTAHLEALVARHAAAGSDEICSQALADSQQSASGIVARFRSFGVLTVLGAGLVDGLNPCAFATLVFFVSYLAFMGRRGREVLAAGGAFTLGVFLTYLGVGLGVLKFLASLPFLSAISRWVYAITALLCVALAVGSLYDWWQARRGRLDEMRMKLPTRMRRWVNRTVREGAGLRAFVPVTFATGVVVSLIELACTGQVYLPTILFVLRIPELRLQAGLYLVFYNLMFILPLVVVFGLAYFGTTSQQLGLFIRRHTAAVKLATAALFVLLAAWMVVTLF